MKPKLKFDRFKSLLPYFLLAVAIIAAYKIIMDLNIFIDFLKQTWTIVTPFFYGFLLAYVLSIPCGGIERILARAKNGFVSKRKKALSISITYVLFLLLLVLTVRLIIPSVYKSILLFIANFQTYYNRAQQFINYINDLDILFIDISVDKIKAMAGSLSMENLSSSINALFSVSSAIFKSFLAFISSIYILYEKERFKAFLSRLIRAFSSDQVFNIIMKYSTGLNENFKKYIYTQTIDGCIIGIIVTIELHLIGSQYALMLGIMLGIVNYIPYFGSIIGTIVAIIVVALTQGLPSAVLTAAILLITQQIDANIIQPKLMGGSFSLSPLLIIVSITIGGAFFGVLGMIAAIPIIAVLKNLLEDIIEYYEKEKLKESEQR